MKESFPGEIYKPSFSPFIFFWQTLATCKFSRHSPAGWPKPCVRACSPAAFHSICCHAHPYLETSLMDLDAIKIYYSYRCICASMAPEGEPGDKFTVEKHQIYFAKPVFWVGNSRSAAILLPQRCILLK